MGGIGTETLMEEFGPNGTSGQHIYAAGLAYDGAIYNSAPSAQRAALCGVPLIVQHGSADATVNPGPDQALARTLSGCAGFQYVEVSGAGHGTWGAGYSDGAQLTQIMRDAAGGVIRTPALAASPRAQVQKPVVSPSQAVMTDVARLCRQLPRTHPMATARRAPQTGAASSRRH